MKPPLRYLLLVALNSMLHLCPALAAGNDSSLPLKANTDLGASMVSKPLDAGHDATPFNSQDWKLVWSDEFDQAGLPDPTKWDYETGLIRNQEKQFYTRNRAENASVSNGQLVITALKESWKGADYTSASLITLGKFSFTYGKVEIRAKVPAGRGVWPAIWTLGQNKNKVGWPQCGEIDLMEFVGMQPDLLHFNVHTKAFNHAIKTNKGTRLLVPEAWRDFHTYGLVWTPQQLDWYLDNKHVFTFANDGQGPDHWPFDFPQYLLLNLAIGGSWGGSKGIDDTIFPATYLIDYVRVYQKP